MSRETWQSYKDLHSNPWGSCWWIWFPWSTRLTYEQRSWRIYTGDTIPTSYGTWSNHSQSCKTTGVSPMWKTYFCNSQVMLSMWLSPSRIRVNRRPKRQVAQSYRGGLSKRFCSRSNWTLKWSLISDDQQMNLKATEKCYMRYDTPSCF